ncbi:hypothetical protein ACHAXR_008153, partial [Thalassiosira sp. AJA248-18]
WSWSFLDSRIDIRYPRYTGTTYPPIKVVIADASDNEDVIIKVSDEGGIPRSNMNRIWSYLFTTADPEIQEGMVAFNENLDHSIDSHLGGLGHGLPFIRSYARYGITGCFVYLTRLGNTSEPLPICQSLLLSNQDFR